jgi:hypothetical protein
MAREVAHRAKVKLLFSALDKVASQGNVAERLVTRHGSAKA